MSVVSARKSGPSAARPARKMFAHLAVVIALMLGVLGIAAVPAMASTDYPSAAPVVADVMLTTASVPAFAMPYYGHGIDVNEACYLKYGGLRQTISANVDNYANAYGWYCQRKVGNNNSVSYEATTDKGASVSAAFGSSTEIIGGIDMQKYCSTYYPGTVATVVNDYAPWWNAFNWRCA